ncbi:MAG: carboxypeptidase-like regulatory domain-containing protein [Planctomycetaceae bacterium]|jgi:hypothetical protein|nr:carboxypeptidase-like regulatory domain-containing protein [Planctomycetaceae bacterium]
MKNTLLIPLLIVFFSLGCNGKPDNVPKNFPCTISVTNGATPIDNVFIVLASETGGVEWSMSGITNASGTATIRTSRLGWQGNGVPAGTYRVTLSKIPTIPEISPEEYRRLSAEEQEAYNNEQEKKREKIPKEIPEYLSDFILSPFQLTVAQGQKNFLAVDVATLPAKPKK